MRLEVNGQPVPGTARPGSYVDVTRPWQTGDRRRIVLPMRVTAAVTPGAGRFAKNLDPSQVPAVNGARNLLAGAVQREAASPGRRFQLTTATPPGAKTSLVPFYAVGLQRYTFYFPYDERR